jgi:hypothetical protein
VIISTTWRMASAVPTELPPNFMTRVFEDKRLLLH